MAIVAKELFSSAAKDKYPRITPHADGVQPKRFDGVSGGPTIKVGSPVASLTTSGLWVELDDAADTGAQLILGFVYPDEIVLDASDEVIGNVMIAGVIHRDDVIDFNTDNAQSSVNDPGVDSALQALIVANSNLIVQGLTDV